MKENYIPKSAIPLRDKLVTLDYDVTRLTHSTLSEIHETVEKNRFRFMHRDLIQLTEEDISELREREPYNELPKDTPLRWAFTLKGLCLLSTLLKDEISRKMTDYLINCFINVLQLRNEFGDLSQCASMSENTRAEKLESCSEIFGKVLSFGGDDFSINILRVRDVTDEEDKEI